MINIPIDEAYAIDFLSIIEVKQIKSNGEKKYFLDAQYTFYKDRISEQIGDSLFNQIIVSIEYSRLKDANLKLFEIIDNSKKYQINAQAIDQYNYRRWQIKDEIQKKYFGKGTGEIKLGYDENR